MELLEVPLSNLEPWPKNPRGITTAGMERLKRQILGLGQYKPLIVKPAGKGWFVVLGGNMRLEALKQIGAEKAWVSVVHPTSEAQELEYALSDNDRVGRYDMGALAKLVLPVKSGLKLEDYAVTLGDETTLPGLMKMFGPASVIQEKEMDESLQTTHECKECGYKW